MLSTPELSGTAPLGEELRASAKELFRSLSHLEKALSAGNSSAEHRQLAAAYNEILQENERLRAENTQLHNRCTASAQETRHVATRLDALSAEVTRLIAEEA